MESLRADFEKDTGLSAAKGAEKSAVSGAEKAGVGFAEKHGLGFNSKTAIITAGGLLLGSAALDAMGQGKTDENGNKVPANGTLTAIKGVGGAAAIWAALTGKVGKTAAAVIGRA